MTYGVVYLLTNLVNGKYYIGQTVNYATKRRSSNAHTSS
jgi:predicted GIY-YIG superfamily endonuclease